MMDFRPILTVPSWTGRSVSLLMQPYEICDVMRCRSSSCLDSWVIFHPPPIPPESFVLYLPFVLPPLLPRGTGLAFFVVWRGHTFFCPSISPRSVALDFDFLKSWGHELRRTPFLCRLLLGQHDGHDIRYPSRHDFSFSVLFLSPLVSFSFSSAVSFSRLLASSSLSASACFRIGFFFPPFSLFLLWLLSWHVHSLEPLASILRRRRFSCVINSFILPFPFPSFTFQKSAGLSALGITQFLHSCSAYPLQFLFAASRCFLARS